MTNGIQHFFSRYVWGAYAPSRAGDRELFLHRRNVLLIEPFLEDRDGIRWIKDLAQQNFRELVF